jgi:hypothetical protein
MSKNGKKNGSGNGRGSEMGRDSKGRFAPGNPGGSGRGNIREAIEEIKELLLDDDVSLTGAEVLDPLGRILLHGTTSKDMKVRTDSAKLYFSWLTKRVEAEQREDQGDLPSAEDIERIRDLLQDRQAMDLSGVKGISDLHCPHCGEKFVSADEADGEG